MIEIDELGNNISNINNIEEVIENNKIEEIYKQKFENKNELIKLLVELHKERDILLKKINNKFGFYFAIILIILAFVLGFMVNRGL